MSDAPPRCQRMVEVTDVACDEMQRLRGRYCADCPLRKESP